MKDFEKFKKQVLAELDKLKEIDNEKVKTVYNKVTTLFNESKDAKDVKDEKKEDEKDSKKDSDNKKDKNPKDDESKVNEKNEKSNNKDESTITKDNKLSEENTKVNDNKVEDSKKTESDDNKKTDAELSDDISKKLKEAAMELSRKDEILVAKDHLLAEKDKQIVELESAIKKYKDAEQLELNKKKEEKVDNLIELYASLGIKKDKAVIKSMFNEEQIDKLAIDLSAMVPQKATSKPNRSVPKQLELNDGKVKKGKRLTDSEKLNILFG